MFLFPQSSPGPPRNRRPEYFAEANPCHNPPGPGGGRFCAVAVHFMGGEAGYGASSRPIEMPSARLARRRMLDQAAKTLRVEQRASRTPARERRIRRLKSLVSRWENEGRPLAPAFF